MAGAKVTDTDTGWRALREAAERLKNVETFSIGVNTNEHRGSKGLTNEQVGAFHEFGLGKNPERSFLRAWLDDEKPWLPQLETEMDRELTGPGDLDWARRFGAWCVKSIQDRMRRGIDPPLSAATEKSGRSGVPLIDTEQLINAIEVEVKGRA
jgi:hypothetical protein